MIACLLPLLLLSLLPQLMWSYASANCPVSSLLHAAAARAAQLAAAAAFTNSKQPLALLGAFRALGLSSSEADEPLRKEVIRLKQIEGHMMQQQQQQECRASEVARRAATEASSVLQRGLYVLDQLIRVNQDADIASAASREHHKCAAAGAAAVASGTVVDSWQQQQHQQRLVQQQSCSARVA